MEEYFEIIKPADLFNSSGVIAELPGSASPSSVAASKPPSPPKKIDFYSDEFNQETSFLGNFYESYLVIGGYTFPCVEAMYQASKFLNPDLPIDDPYNVHILQQFANLIPTSGKHPADAIGDAAWRLGQELKRQGNPVRDHFNQGVHEEIMEKALRLKFGSSQLLSELLLKTGKDYLNERTDRDAFWGDGADGKGQNRLGKLLMKLRSELEQTGAIDVPAELSDIMFPS